MGPIKPPPEQKPPPDPEAELSNAVRMFKKLAPRCSVAQRASGAPQLAPQQKQLKLLADEMKEILLCINMSKKGMHKTLDARTQQGTAAGVSRYEQLHATLRDERAQLDELDCLNYLAQKQLIELVKVVPTGADELAMIESANQRLRRMENRLDLAVKRFCVVNADNAQVRQEINRLLVERNDFNTQWNRTIGKLVRGKEYMMDLLEIAAATFGDRDEACRKLDALKWKGLFQLNKDISEMQSYEGEMNHLAKLEEFLRVKGTKRICEADEKEELRRLEEIRRCEEEIARHDALLEAIFQYAGTSSVSEIITTFDRMEIENFSCFLLLCELLQESIVIRKELDAIRRTIMDQRDINEGREAKQARRLEELRLQVEESSARTAAMRESNKAADVTIAKALAGIDELVRMAKCDLTPLLALLGPHKQVTRWNVDRFLGILEVEVKGLIEVVHTTAKPPPPSPRARRASVAAAKRTSSVTVAAKPVGDPVVVPLKPNPLEKLMPYTPCAYCVEDYVLNQVFETPAAPADREYVEAVFHLDEPNTKFGIYSLTIPAKRHPFRKKETQQQ
ncbi:hypothetical protein JYU34_012227 [Plutella xylostella]|uniref:ODAD1 central coiled coil region domain-containing protein n=1 Tax=Plutella xylostella TaxID=51655 RepID=A0ABQ7QFW3_PLUXY|nr:hypothetical protein JYU34_012227 [Plutella xylostella]